MTPQVLVLYPYFPKYRRQILSELQELTDADFKIAAGTTGRASITPLTKDDFPQLNELQEVRFGPVSIHPEIIRRPGLKEFDAVVLAPATLSITVWAVLIARKLRGRPTLLWGQCGRPHDRSLKRRVQELMNRLASKLLVYGEIEQKSAGDFGTPQEKIEIVRNANDHSSPVQSMSSQDLQELAKSRGIGNQQAEKVVRLLYIGRITASKKLEQLIEAVEILRNSGISVEASIVGDGTALEELKTLSDGKQLPINFPGGLYSDAELQPYLDKATLIVAPSSIGLLAIDALNNAIPVIYPDDPTKNGPEFEALTNGVNAVHFAEASGQSIAEAIQKWMTDAPSIDLHHFEDITRRSVSVWSPKRVAQNIANSVLSTLKLQRHHE